VSLPKIQFLTWIRHQRCLKAVIKQWQKKLWAITRTFFSRNQDHSNEPRLHHGLRVPPREYGFRVLMELSLISRWFNRGKKYIQTRSNTCVLLTQDHWSQCYSLAKWASKIRSGPLGFCPRRDTELQQKFRGFHGQQDWLLKRGVWLWYCLYNDKAIAMLLESTKLHWSESVKN